MRKVQPYRFVPQTSYPVEQFDRWSCGSGFPPPEPLFSAPHLNSSPIPPNSWAGRKSTLTPIPPIPRPDPNSAPAMTEPAPDLVAADLACRRGERLVFAG